MQSNITVTLALSAMTLLAGGLGNIRAQGCTALPASSEFTVEQIAVAAGWPFDIVALKDGRVFWVERYGAFKVYDATTKAISTIKQFSVFTTKTATFFGDVENGLEGMALDPNFATNHWVYIWYTPPPSGMSQHNLGPVQRLSRFTLKTNDTQLDDASEKVIFEQKIFAQCCHFGGAMKMTEDGTLYLSTGDNTHYNYTGTGADRAFDETNVWSDPRNTSSNTNDTRGKILRIKPIAFADAQTPAPGVGTTYTIPAGNLKETWDTPEKEKVRPEIYSMGHRNPFSISIHPDKPWVGIGEANGDNAKDGDDEINIVTKAGNQGWPFLIGANQNYIPGFWTARNYNPSQFATSGITNDSKFNTGAKILPPATGAAITVSHGGMNMPINCHGLVWGWVKYDPANPNKGKFPPYLQGKLLVSGYGTADVRAATVDESGKVTKLETLFSASFGGSNGKFTTDVLRGTQGADGAFYVGVGAGVTFPTNSNCKVFKISYKGDCSTVSTRPTQDQIRKLVSNRRPITHFGSTEVSIPDGIRRVRAYDISGKKVWETSRASDEGVAMAGIPATVPSGALKLRYFQN